MPLPWLIGAAVVAAAAAIAAAVSDDDDSSSSNSENEDRKKQERQAQRQRERAALASKINNLEKEQVDTVKSQLNTAINVLRKSVSKNSQEKKINISDHTINKTIENILYSKEQAKFKYAKLFITILEAGSFANGAQTTEDSKRLLINLEIIKDLLLNNSSNNEVSDLKSISSAELRIKNLESLRNQLELKKV